MRKVTRYRILVFKKSTKYISMLYMFYFSLLADNILLELFSSRGRRKEPQ